MKRVVLAFVLPLAFLFAFAPGHPHAGALNSSIQPLYLDNLIGCTTFSVSKKDRLWVTAAHCTLQENEKFGIGAANATAIVIRRNDVYDIALLQGGLPTPPLELSDHGPRTGDEARIEGFAIGQPQSLTFFGRVSNPRYTFPEEDYESATYDVQLLPGASGSPILVRGQVVGTASGIYKGKVGQIVWGSTWGQLKDFVGPVWEGEQ